MDKDNKPRTRGKLDLIFLSIKALLPLLISHHPFCKKFESHTFKIGRFYFCIGCFIGYPTAIITFLILKYGNVSRLISGSTFLLFSIILLSFFILSPLHLTENRKIKIIQKILIAIGGAFLLYYLTVLFNFQMGIIVIGFILLLLNINHLYGIFKKCYNCETPFDWGYCEGFRTINSILMENNLHKFLDGLRNNSYRIWHKRQSKRN